MRADASQPLPFSDGSFDAISCIDALNHLPGRYAVFADWARLLAPGGRLLFTDPVTITGLVGAEELAIRSSIGYFDFAPLGEDERLLVAAGLKVLAVEDLTEAVAGVARHRCTARAQRAAGAPGDRGRRGLRAPPAVPRHRRDHGARAAHLALRVPRPEEPCGVATGRQPARETSRSTENSAEVTASTSSVVASSRSSVSTSFPSRTRNTQSSVITTPTAAFAVSG